MKSSVSNGSLTFNVTTKKSTVKMKVVRTLNSTCFDKSRDCIEKIETGERRANLFKSDDIDEVGSFDNCICNHRDYPWQQKLAAIDRQPNKQEKRCENPKGCTKQQHHVKYHSRCERDEALEV